MTEQHDVFDNPVIRTWQVAVPLLVRWQAPSETSVQLVRKRDIMHARHATADSPLLDRHSPTSVPFPAAAVHTGKHFLPVEVLLPLQQAGTFLRATVWFAWWVHDAALVAQYPNLRVSKHLELWLNHLVSAQPSQWSARDPARQLSEILGDQQWRLDFGVTVQRMDVIVADQADTASSEARNEDHDDGLDVSQPQDGELRQIQHRMQCLQEQVDAALRLADRLQDLGHRGLRFAELGPLAFLGIQALIHGLDQQLIDALRQELERVEQHRRQVGESERARDGQAPDHAAPDGSAEANLTQPAAPQGPASEAGEVSAAGDSSGIGSYAEVRRNYHAFLETIKAESSQAEPRAADDFSIIDAHASETTATSAPEGREPSPPDLSSQQEAPDRPGEQGLDGDVPR